MRSLFYKLKLLDFKKKLIIGIPLGILVLFGIVSVIYATLIAPRTKERAATQNTGKAETGTQPISIECPDKVEYDTTTGLPIWIKGEQRRNISGEEDSWITQNCKAPTPTAEAPAVPTTDDKKTGKDSKTDQLASKPTANSSNSEATSSPSTASTPSAPSTSEISDSSPSSTPSQTPTPSPTPAPEEEAAPVSPPVLKNLGVNFAPYDAEADRAGAFPFIYQNDKPFFEFGDQGTEPTFTYMIDEAAEVFAVADGYVRAVNYQASIDDYSILVSTDSEDHTWTIDYDHLINPRVSAGDRITAGTVLGNPEPMGLGLGRVEIQVFGPNAQGQLTSYCPFNYFDPSLIGAYKAKLTQLMNDYNAYKLLSDPYSMDNYTTSGHVGCLVSSMAE